MNIYDGSAVSGAGVEPAPPGWESRAVARTRGLADLLSRRPELWGVYPPADVTAEALRWSA